jgi:hypothetical protein
MKTRVAGSSVILAIFYYITEVILIFTAVQTSDVTYMYLINTFVSVWRPQAAECSCLLWGRKD